MSTIGSKLSEIKFLLIILACLCAMPETIFSQSFPSGFSQVQLANGISNPTCMAFANDGRLFICNKNGDIYIYKNGALNASPFATINTNYSGERGLLGLTFDPDFSNNHYIYIYYTTATGTKNRITRITANGDNMLAGSEVVILALDPLTTATNHNGGCLKFGPDGKLYVSVGDNTVSAFAQNLDSYMGKILRINPDGSTPVDNPYITGTAQKKRIWSYGLRNPFTFDIQPGTGKIFVNDVGLTSWEEINEATLPNNNFGWPNTEGTAGNSSYTDPAFSYPHGAGDGYGCAITSGVFFNPPSSVYPASYTGNYFYTDYCNSWINMLEINGSTITRLSFANGIASSPIGLTVGPDGNLYYLSRVNQALYKIVYTPTSSLPVINTQPVNATVNPGQSVTFSVNATSSSPMSYAWKKDNITIAGATNSSYTISSVTAADSGNYKCVITNATGSITSNSAKLTVTTNTPPVATITSPVNGSYYRGGETIYFSGSATDAQSGSLNTSAYNWYLEFHHDTHIHPGPGISSGIKSGSFIIPNTGEVSDNVFYRLFLYVTDPQGATDTTYVDLLPRKSSIYLYTDPPGLLISVDGIPMQTPATVSSVEGVIRILAPTSPQLFNSNTYTFDHWASGGSTIKSFATPVGDTTLTAYYTYAYRLPDNPASTANGIYYKFYTGNWDSLPDFTSLNAVAEGSLNNFSLSPRTVNDYFAFNYSGYIDVPVDGLYTFYTSSDDGSKLLIGKTVVVDNDGPHAELELSGTIGLQAGKHEINVQYFERAGTQTLDVSWSGPTIAKQLIPNGSLSRISGSIERNVLEDSYVRSGSYAYTYMGQTDIKKLITKYGTGTGDMIRETYLKFDITGFTTDYSTVTLDIFGKLRGADLITPVTVNCIPLSNTYWHESTLTYVNRPLSSFSPIAQTSVNDINGKYYNIDITDYITQSINAGLSEVSFILKGTAVQNNYVQWYAKEYGSAYAPRLSFNYAAPRIPASGNNPVNENDIAIYPNPSNGGIINIFIPLKNESAIIHLFNIQGKLIRSLNTSTSFNTVPIDDLPNGLYFVEIIKSNKLFTRKLEVIR